MIKPNHIKKFKKICKDLNSLISQIQKYNPEANYYLANDWLNLMKGPSHDNSNPMRIEESHDNVVEAIRIKSADGGDW